MMEFGTKRYEWIHITPLTNAQNVVIPLAYGAGAGDMIYIAPGKDLLYLTWGVESQLNFFFIVEGANDSTFATFDTLVGQNCLAGGYYRPYQLPAPYTGGHITITSPLIRIRLTDIALADHTYTRVYVKGWWV
jgi:hypothetical protein